MSNEIVCPKCGSNQLTANKKGFSGKKAVAGAFLTGGIGLLAGTIGSNKVKITCLSCGHEFKPGQGTKSTSNYNKPKTQSEIKKDQKLDQAIGIGCVTVIVIVVIIFFIAKSCA
jgi:hypothetical protein